MNLNNDFEKSKKQLQVSESIQKVKNNYLVKNTIVELIRSIPVFGPLLDDSIDATLTEFQEAKREELLSIISKDIGNITTDMVNNVEFIMNFAKTLEAVNRLSSNDKVKYFATMLKSGYLVDNPMSTDEFDEYLFNLSMLSYRQINLLIDLFVHEKNNISESISDESKKDNKLASRSGKWGDFIDMATSKYNLTKEEVVAIFSGISKTGFCAEVVGTYLGYTGGVFYITSSCEKFVKMITGGLYE